MNAPTHAPCDLCTARTQVHHDTTTTLRRVEVVQLAHLIAHQSEQSYNRLKEAVSITVDGHKRQLEQGAHPITISLCLTPIELMWREVFRGVGLHNYGVRASECSVV